MIISVILVSLLLKLITANEENCGPSIRGQYLHYDVSSDPDFQLWLKMTRKNTWVYMRVETVASHRPQVLSRNTLYVLSNTEEYRRFPNANYRNLHKINRINRFYSLSMWSNASMEWIFCKTSNSSRAPSLPACNTTDAPSLPACNTEAVTVLVVLVVVVLVLLAAAIAYIHHLRKTLTQFVVSQFKYNKYSNEDSSQQPWSPHTRPSIQDNIYEEWQERPPAAGASHNSSTNSIYGQVVNLPGKHQLPSDGNPNY
ncbi:uncharacterized protein [Procambarus clarkii]|uniref:uncharacterized protein isoform X2 n=1 Tax=Procambarus clarkii TaxID=6728 RepID=UPI001E676D63|nr:uncharacterized protein LOC123745080 isoform X2 [Procambarus clarkii]